MTFLSKSTAISSIAQRIFSVLFLRVFLPQFITILFAIYNAGFWTTFLTSNSYEVLIDEFDVLVKPTKDAAGRLIEKVEVNEDVILVEKDPRYLKTLLTGLPSPSSVVASVTTFIINVLLALMVWDLTYRADWLYPETGLSFVRLGYVSDTTAKILIREPDQSQLPVVLSYRYADPPLANPSLFEGAWKQAASIKAFSNDTDFTVTTSIIGLKPDTRYQFVTSNNHSGFFVTAPRVGEITHRATSQQSFSFVHTSCIIKRFPYSPWQHPLHVPGFKYLAPWLSVLKPAFMMFLGDFIYIDVPTRPGSDVATYRKAYRQIYGSPDWPSVTSTKQEMSVSDYEDFNIPWLHVYDDHEISDDWDRNTTGVYPAAFDPYIHYHVSPNPPAVRPARSSWLSRTKSIDTDSTYFSFTQGPASFFMLDTRRFRTNHRLLNASILGSEQMQDFLKWIAAPVPRGVRWKFVISSVPFTKNWPVNNGDTWGGYLTERQRVLEAMWNAMAVNSVSIVILSGDRHEFAATAFPPPIEQEAKWPREKCTVHEFSTSPLDMFYSLVRTYRQTDRQDVQLKYIPEGNHKFGAIQIGGETRSGQSLLNYRLFVEGKEIWSHILVSEPLTIVGRDAWS